LPAVICLALAVPAAAEANVYCVGEPACPAGALNEGSGASGLQKALSSAAAHANGSEPDQVLVGAGEYSRSGGFQYSGDAVSIRGAGEGATVLTTNTAAKSTVLALTTTAASPPSLSGLTIQIPKSQEPIGLVLTGGTVEDVAIQGGGLEGPGVTVGLEIFAGVFSHGTISLLQPTGTSQAVESHGGEVLDSTLTGSYGVQESGTATLRGCRISAYTPLDDYNSQLTVEDSLIDLRGTDNTALKFGSNRGYTATGVLRGVTIVNGGPDSMGMSVEATTPEGRASTTTVTLEDSIISHVTHPIYERNQEPGATATVTTDYSSFEAGGDQLVGENGAPTPTVTDHDPVSTTPDFVDPVFGENGFSEGDWRLLASSPLIDAGTPGSLPAGELATDAAGNPRLVNGRRDVGAFEYQRRGPVVSASANVSTVGVGQAVSFSGSATEPEPGDSVAGYQWSFDNGTSAPTGATATHVFASPGVHTATLTATDLLGVSSAATVTVRVTATPGGPVIGCACAERIRGITSLRFSSKAFRAARSGSSTTRRAHVGTLVSFTMPEKATVRFTVERLLPGFLHARKCLARARGHADKHCTRRLEVRGSFAATLSSGPHSLRFTGRLSGKALPPGNYLLLASIVGSRAAPATAAFKILH
jgi:PKD repeat protein